MDRNLGYGDLVSAFAFFEERLANYFCSDHCLELIPIVVVSKGSEWFILVTVRVILSDDALQMLFWCFADVSHSLDTF